jgi:membrane protein DedA with SNARE-associated domain
MIGAAVEANPAMGYGAIALVMLLENLIPPIPSEVVMPYGGYLVHQGRLELLPTVLAGVLGTVLGAWFWYGIGRLTSGAGGWVSMGRIWPAAGAGSAAMAGRWCSGGGWCPGCAP